MKKNLICSALLLACIFVSCTMSKPLDTAIEKSNEAAVSQKEFKGESIAQPRQTGEEEENVDENVRTEWSVDDKEEEETEQSRNEIFQDKDDEDDEDEDEEGIAVKMSPNEDSNQTNEDKEDSAGKEVSKNERCMN